MNNPKEWPLSDRLRYRWDIFCLLCARAWLHCRLTWAGWFARQPAPVATTPDFVVTQPEERSRRGWILATIAGTTGLILLLFFLFSGERGTNRGAEVEIGKPELALLGSAEEETFLPPQAEPAGVEVAQTLIHRQTEPADSELWTAPAKITNSEPVETELVIAEASKKRARVFIPDEPKDEEKSDDSLLAFRDEPPQSRSSKPVKEEALTIEEPEPRSEISATKEASEPALEITEVKSTPPAEEKPAEPTIVEEEPRPVRPRVIETEESPAAEAPRSVDDEPIVAKEPDKNDIDSIPWKRSVTPRRNTTTVVPAADPFDQPLEPMQPVSGTVPVDEQKAVPAQRQGSARIEIVRALPETAGAGSGVLTYEIIVRNRGTAALEQLTVEERIPAGLRVSSSNPPGTVEGRVIRWELSDLGPAAEEAISISLVTERRAESVRTAPETRVRREPPPTAGRASLRLKIDAPARLQRGQSGIIRFYVMNTGTAGAQRVQISTDLPSHLSHPRGPALIQELGTIAVGETRIIDLRVTAVRSGSEQQHATVTASGDVRGEADTAISVLDQVTSMAGCGKVFQ